MSPNSVERYNASRRNIKLNSQWPWGITMSQTPLNATLVGVRYLSVDLAHAAIPVTTDDAQSMTTQGHRSF